MSTTHDLVKAPHILGVPKVDVKMQAGHVYTVNGARVRGVTSILRDSGISSSWMPDQYFLDRGTLIHLALAMAARDRLDESSLPDAYRGYVLSGLRVLKGRTNLVPELAVGSAMLLYGGILDLLLLDGLELWDYKSGPKKSWDRLQTAGYRIALRETYGIRVKKTRGIYLQADGSAPKIEKYDDKGDEAEFMVLVNYLRVYDKIHPRAKPAKEPIYDTDTCNPDAD